MNKTVILIMTHRDSPVVKREFEKLKSDLGDEYDFKILFHKKDDKQEIIHLNKEDLYCFDNSILTDYGFSPISKTVILGSEHFVLMDFARNHSYDYYWFLEDDVRFSGDWKVFFDEMKQRKHDYIASHFHKRPEYLVEINAFNAIYRISKEALSFLDYMCSKGGLYGHHEQTIINSLSRFCYDIMDFGGLSKFCPVELREKFYENSFYGQEFTEFNTHRFRPVFDKIGNRENKIYHPVKDF